MMPSVFFSLPLSALPLVMAATPDRPSVSCIDTAMVSFVPARPRAGTLFRIVLSRSPANHGALSGRLAGEPLSFAEGAAGTMVAFAALPIDSVRGATLALACPSDSTNATAIRIRAAPGAYPVEALRVDPRFTAPLDSALAERTRQEGARAADVARASRGTPRLWTASFVRPRPSRVTSAFGTGRAFNGTVTSRHMGTDLAGPAGAPVRASNRGVVRLVDAFYYGGNVVYVDHGGGFTTAYLHLSQTLVAPGDTVDRGALLGRVGATGRVTAPHLHFITRFGEITVDPLSVLAATEGGTGR